MRTYTRGELAAMTAAQLVTVCLINGWDEQIKVTDSQADLINKISAAQQDAADSREWSCVRCGQPVTLTRGHWWSVDDDFMCPDGEERHRVSD